MQLVEIIKVIEKIAIPAGMADWDNSGIQVASTRADVHHLAVLLDPTPAGIERAIAGGSDFILTHHPLSMKPRFLDSLGDYHQVVSLLLTHRVCLYSAHTSLDANPIGPASWLADALALHDRNILEVTCKAPCVAASSDSLGFGFVGTLPESMGYADFCKKLAAISGKQEWGTCGPIPKRVQRVACCPGSGSSMIEEAERSGADIFITGDVKYHAALEAKIRVLDLGHFILEEEMIRRFALMLERELADIKVTFLPAKDPLAQENALTI